MNKKQKKNLFRILISSSFLIIYKFINFENETLNFLLYLIPYFIVGYDILKKAFKGFLNHSLFDENFLMAIATVGAIALGDYSEGVAVMLFYQIGEFFQSYALTKSRKNIADLMDIKPEYANILVNDEYQKVDPASLNINDIFLVKVGEKVPLDGVVVEGQSTLNTSALTGEAKPKGVKEKDEVISGCINLTAPIKIKATKKYEDSTVNKVLDLIENATSNKAKSEDFISKFARYYTPVVCYSALALCLIPPFINHFILGNNYEFKTWLFRALTFLVISCPCALVISIPLTFFAGIGGASKSGILIKGSNHLENLSNCKYVAFDKTGTMTLGIFEVTTIHNNELSADELLAYAAHGEAFSNHPIAISIVKEYGQKIDKKRIKSVKEISGKGIIALIDEHEVIVGNEKLMNDNNIQVIPCDDLGTIIHLAIDKNYKGHIHIGDKIKENSPKAIQELKKMGIKETIMLTGDEQSIGNQVNKTIKLDKVYGNLLPQDKVKFIKELIAQRNNKELVCFVGDGLNDAPVISLADLGIAMGALGSDAAIEAADIVLMDDDPLKVAKAIKIAKKCMRIVYENIYFAIGIKVVCLVATAFGYSNMWLAIFADTGVLVIDVINAIRALRVKNI